MINACPTSIVFFFFRFYFKIYHFSRLSFSSQLSVSLSINLLSVGLDFWCLFFRFQIIFNIDSFFFRDISIFNEQTITRKKIKENIQLFIFTLFFFFLLFSFSLFAISSHIIIHSRFFSLSLSVVMTNKRLKKKKCNISRIIMTPFFR